MKTRLILASGSPRRIELLGQMGYRFQVCVPQVDETPRPHERAVAMVSRLALLKAETIAAKSARKRILILAADTTVVEPSRGRILGKPESRKQAIQMLGMIQGKTHVVCTGYCLVAFNAKGARKTIRKTIQTKVTIDRLTREEIATYVRTGEPMDKAGAYAAQGIGAGFISKIAGSYTNVVGLPVAQVRRDLERLLRWAK